MPQPLLFDELLDGLRAEGFSVGTDQYLRMHQLFELHPNASPDELRTLLGPIFAMSAVEQERFHVAYNEFFAARPARGTAIPQRGLTIPGTVAIPLPPPATRWKRVAAAVLVIAMILAIAAWYAAREPAAVDVVEETTTATTVPAVPVQPLPSPPPPRGTSLFLWILTAAVVLAAAEVARTLMRWLRHREHDAHGRPFDWPVRDPHPTAPRLFADQRFFAIARLMKGREIGEVRRIDVTRSILAMIRNLGDPAFEYKHDRRVTEYLFLVERRAERDHLAAYVHAMLDALMRDGVLVEVFEHDGDPRHCWKPGSSARISTADLYARFPQHRLVIAGNAVALTDPVTGDALDSIPRLFPWNHRAILTPEDETRGLRRFGTYFDVYALADNGLARLAERWQQDEALPQRRRARERRRNLADLPSSVDELERELDPLIFRWLLRCAVHPTLHWDLTRELAPPLTAAEHEAKLLELSRLQWFRLGRIPEPERLALVARLSDDAPEETAARASALRVLAAAPPPPAGSVAARSFEIQQLAHRIWSARDRSELRPLMRELRRYPPRQVERDGALMMFLQSQPRALPRFLYRDGIPAFGWKSFITLTAVVPVMAFAGIGAWQQTRQPETISAATPAIETIADTPAAPPSSPLPVAAETAPPVTQAESVAIATTTTPIIKEIPPAKETVEVKKPPVRNLEPPVLAALPALISPAANTVVTIAAPSDAVTFTWQPAGKYTLQVLSAQGQPVHTKNVAGSSTAWKPSSGSDHRWMLITSDGRSTEAMPFRVEYEVAFPESGPIQMYRNVEVTLPVGCAPADGKYDVNLRLTARETFERAEVKVVNRAAFAVAEVTLSEGASFTYRFAAAQPCTDDSLQAKVQLTATVRLAPVAAK